MARLYRQQDLVTAMWVWSLFLTLTYALIPIPKPNGIYAVGHNTMKLVDVSRYDPFAPDDRKRAVMISIFYPVPEKRCRQTRLAEYMPPATAAFEDQQFAQYGVPNQTLEQLRLQVCCDSPKHQSEDASKYSIILFSPGLGSPRLFYNIIAQSVSSSGYIVVTIDHPYDADIVEYPDGSIVYSNITSIDNSIELAVMTRAQDASFVLSQLGIASVVKQLIPGSSCGLDVHRACMFGHSLGGATTASAMLNDSRIMGGIDMDGSLFGPVVQEGLDNPFLIFNHEGYTRANDTSWAEIWPHLRGWKQELEIEGTEHSSYEDLPILADILGLRRKLPPEVVAVIGTIGGFRMLEILTTYVTAFFAFVLDGRASSLLQRPSPLFPEVSFVS